MEIYAAISNMPSLYRITDKKSTKIFPLLESCKYFTFIYTGQLLLKYGMNSQKMQDSNSNPAFLLILTDKFIYFYTISGRFMQFVC